MRTVRDKMSNHETDMTAARDDAKRRQEEQIQTHAQEIATREKQVHDMRAELERVTDELKAVRMEHDHERVKWEEEMRGVRDELSRAHADVVRVDASLTERDTRIRDMTHAADVLREQHSKELTMARDGHVSEQVSALQAQLDVMMQQTQQHQHVMDESKREAEVREKQVRRVSEEEKAKLLAQIHAHKQTHMDDEVSTERACALFMSCDVMGCDGMDGT